MPKKLLYGQSNYKIIVEIGIYVDKTNSIQKS